MPKISDQTKLTTPKVSVRNRSKVVSIEALSSSEYDVIEIFKQQKLIQKYLSFDLEWTEKLAQSLPIGLRGQDHTDSRISTAKIMGKGRVQLLEDLPTLTHQYFHILDQKGKHDFLNGIAKPFVDECMMRLSGIKVPIGAFDNLAYIFDPGCSISKRKKSEKSIQNLFRITMEQYPNLPLKAVADRIAVATMGKDALLGSICFSMEAFFKCFSDQDNRQKLGKVPLETGVPYVWREQTLPESKRGVGYSNAVECRLDIYSDKPDKERMRFFGAGKHTCLGKVHSIDIFDAISGYVENLTPKTIKTSLKEDESHVLRVPTEMFIEVS